MTMQYEELLNVPYVEGKTDCFSLMRGFYKLNFGIEMADYARPPLWWAKAPELDLLRRHLTANGFIPYDRTPRNMQEGDGLLFQIGNTVVNHCGAYLGGGRFLHHPFRGKSQVSLLGGAYADQVMIYCRHPEVPYVDSRPSIDFLELLPNQKREQYRAILAQRG